MVFVFNSRTVDIPIYNSESFEKRVENSPNRIITFKEEYSTFIRYEVETWVEA